MADPTTIVTAHASQEIDTDHRLDVIKNAEQLVIWAVGMLNRSLGKVEFADDAADLIPAGIILKDKTGLDDSTHLLGNSSGTTAVVTQGRLTLKGVTVTGVSAITDIGKFVYMTDGQTFTLTKPSVGVPVGIVVGWTSSTTCDVFLFNFVQGVLNGLARQPQEYKTFGCFTTDALTSTSETVLWTETSKQHYKILSVHAQPKGFDAGLVAGAQTVAVKIGGVATTGGVLTLGYASFDAYDDMGTVIDATAVTAANEVHIGDVVTLVMAASGTGFTANQSGAGEIYMLVEFLPGA